MQLEGRYTPHIYASQSTFFSIIILHQCYLTTIIPSTDLKNVTFVMGAPDPGAMFANFSQWKETLGFCGPFTYSAKLMRGTGLPNFITFNKNQREFLIR